jgi:8-oxo-dGTP pyrophosphatase MutT (NUDIX family)
LDTWTLAAVTTHLRKRLALPLPGVAAQELMAPRPRRGWKPGSVPDQTRPAAALILLYDHDGEATCVLTLRASHLPQHAGQVSLPGGRLDPGETLIEAALREAEEEVGVTRTHVDVLGALTPLHIPVSGFILHPIVGVTPDRPDFVAARHEVARITDASVSLLASADSWRLTSWVYEGREFEIPYFAVADLQVWGATAMVLSEFVSLFDVSPVARRTQPGPGGVARTPPGDL